MFEVEKDECIKHVNKDALFYQPKPSNIIVSTGDTPSLDAFFTYVFCSKSLNWVRLLQKEANVAVFDLSLQSLLHASSMHDVYRLTCYLRDILVMVSSLSNGILVFRDADILAQCTSPSVLLMYTFKNV